MAFPWSGGKDEESRPSDLSDPAGERTSDLEQLTGQLEELGGLLARANETVTSYLVHRDSQAADRNPLGEKIQALAEKLDRLAGAGDVSSGSSPTAAPDENSIQAAIAPLGEKIERMETTLQSLAENGGSEDVSGPPVAEILDALNQSIRQLQQHTDSQLQLLAEQLIPADDSEEPDAGLSTDWQQAILGSELVENSALAFQRQQLLNSVLEGDPGACSLAGQLLVFQSAPPERLPQLLKEVGEAYYRWQPKTTPGSNAMEEALVRWLRSTCEAAGIGNTVELVHPGERFDTTRHTASSRGVEITEVRGWIVLRDNGRVYTKANVAVR